MFYTVSLKKLKLKLYYTHNLLIPIMLWGYSHNANLLQQCHLIRISTPTVYLPYTPTYTPPHTHPYIQTFIKASFHLDQSAKGENKCKYKYKTSQYFG